MARRTYTEVVDDIAGMLSIMKYMCLCSPGRQKMKASNTTKLRSICNHAVDIADQAYTGTHHNQLIPNILF